MKLTILTLLLIVLLACFALAEETTTTTTGVNDYGIEEDLENENISLEELLERLDEKKGTLALSQQTDLFFRKIPLVNKELVTKLADRLASEDAKFIKRLVFNKNGPNKENELDQESLKILIENGFLKQTYEPSLEVLGVTSNKLSLESCSLISKLIFSPRGINLKKLYFYNNEWSNSECLEKIFEPILSGQKSTKDVPQLTKLSIIQNQVGDKVATIVTQLANTIPSLSNIVLRDVNLGEEGIVNIAKFIQNKPNQLIRLDISENRNIGLNGFSQLITSLRNDKTILTHLDINNIGMDSNQAVTHLANLIRENKSLKKIDLSDNQIGDSGIEILMTPIQQSQSNIAKLDLSNTGVTKVGVQTILKTLELNKNIKRIFLYRTDLLTDETLEAELKAKKDIIKSDYVIDEEKVEDDVQKEEEKDVNVAQEEAEEMSEEEEPEMTEEEMKAHPLFNEPPQQITTKDEL
ncbi:hypothetical protein ABK040_016568 [Willaertia magna]